MATAAATVSPEGRITPFDPKTRGGHPKAFPIRTGEAHVIVLPATWSGLRGRSPKVPGRDSADVSSRR